MTRTDLGWAIALLMLLFLACRQPSWPRRLLALVLVVAGFVVDLNGWRIGPRFKVWREEARLLQQLTDAMRAPGDADDDWRRAVRVDRSDGPPVRAALLWFASHGDVMGVAYDPTGKVAEAAKSREWLYRSRARHLFGAWYWFSN